MYKRKDISMNNNKIPLSPAYLWIGSPTDLDQKAISFLQKSFCNDACSSCIECTKISNKQHHAITWITPEKQYTIDQLAVVFSTIAFALNTNEHHFFILQNADFLSPVCANALLKPLEEPPAGYHFILLAQQQDRIISTIRSRCIIQHFAHHQNTDYEKLLRHFKKITTANPQQFLIDVEQIKSTEHTSATLLDSLIDYWGNTHKRATINQQLDSKKTTAQIVTLLSQQYKKLPMPGSAKLFWKNLFLQFNQIIEKQHIPL